MYCRFMSCFFIDKKTADRGIKTQIDADVMHLVADAFEDMRATWQSDLAIARPRISFN